MPPPHHPPLDAAYLYQTHPSATLRHWARSLRYFRFCRAHKSHLFNDGDRFLAALRFAGEAALLELLAALGLTVEPLPPGDESARIYTAGPDTRRPLPDFPHLTIPSRQSIAGIPLFLSISGGRTQPGRIDLTITAPDDPFNVNEQAFEGAQRVETRLEPYQASLIDPPLAVDSEYCLCPQVYPQVWAATAGGCP